jgi:hypothetical protein
LCWFGLDDPCFTLFGGLFSAGPRRCGEWLFPDGPHYSRHSSADP